MLVSFREPIRPALARVLDAGLVPCTGRPLGRSGFSGLPSAPRIRGSAAVALVVAAAWGSRHACQRRWRRGHAPAVTRRARGFRTRDGRNQLLRPETCIASPGPAPLQIGSGPSLCTGVAELAERYDAFTLDQYGVLHDGQTAYPGVTECLQELRAAEKPCVILSNFAGRAAAQRARLPKLGLNPEQIVGVVTSGELAHRYLGRRQDTLGSRCLWISWAEREARGLDDYFDGLDGFSLAEDADNADFILVSGVESLFAGTPAEKVVDFERDGKPAPFLATFRRAIHRSLPMICANPDLRVVRPGGWKAYLPGTLAKFYEQLGGRVIYFGKPYTAAFEEARRLLEDAGAGGRICHIGDSLDHDIAGAFAVGLDSALVVRTGIHATALQEEPSAQDVRQLCEKENAPLPTAVLPLFAW